MSRPISHVNLKIPFFTDEILNKIKVFAVKAHEENDYQWNPPGGIGLSYFKGELLSIVDEYVNDMIIDSRGPPMFAITGANTLMHKHIDDFGIYSKILIPLLPMKNLQPCPYYHEDGSLEMVEMKPYRPVLMDTYIPHGGYITNDSIRVTLQLTFNIRMNEVIELIKAKQFTKTFECSIL